MLLYLALYVRWIFKIYIVTVDLAGADGKIKKRVASDKVRSKGYHI